MDRSELESVVSDKAQPYHQKGRALEVLHLSDHWKQHGSFSEYCRVVFGFTHNRATQLINAGRVCDVLLQSGITPPMLPAQEGIARPLAQLPAESMVLAWNYLTSVAEPQEITGELVQRVADQIRAGRVLRILTDADLPDAAFPSDNEFQIPLLLSSLQAVAVPLPLEAYGATRQSGPGTYHFYTDDRRILPLIGDPTPIVNACPVAAIEPNFSLYGQMPRALALGRIYHKRWIARFWQSHGIQIIVDLNVAPEHAEDNLLGVPSGWRSYATRGYTDRLDHLQGEYDQACRHAGSPEILFVVYGGGSKVKELARAQGWLWFNEERNRPYEQV